MPCGVHPIGRWLWGLARYGVWPTAFAWYLRHYRIFSAFAYSATIARQPVSEFGFQGLCPYYPLSPFVHPPLKPQRTSSLAYISPY